MLTSKITEHLRARELNIFGQQTTLETPKMTYMNRDNSGALFKNAEKRDDASPDYSGRITIDGKEYWLSAWIKEARAGSKFMSLAARPKEAARPMAKPARTHSWREDL
jgi:hypothetical protein